MNRGMDRHLQRIMDNAADGNASRRPDQARNYAFTDARPAEYSFQPSSRFTDTRPAEFGFQSNSRQLDPDPMLLNEFVDRASNGSKPSRQQLTTLNTAPARLSLGPPNTYTQPGNEPRAITNADTHFRFGQNLRQGLPINRAPPQPPPPLANNFNNQQAPSPLTQLATNMILRRPMPQASPEVNLFQGLNPNRLNQLQPRRQEITPPFNLSGFIYSPNTQQPKSSSPASIPLSSPTARVSLRRATNRIVPRSEHPGQDYGIEDLYEEPPAPSAPPETPRHQMAALTRATTRYTPKPLALGHAPPMAHGIQLVSPHELPDRFRQVFPYELFNAVQSKCFAHIYKSNDNVVVSAPTGSGKTALLELAICKLVEGHPSGQFKIVYQAPTKSLCSERMRDWQKKFSHLSLECAELTGDTSHREMNKVGAASIIVTTPEKWDSITRKWKDYSRLLQLVKLFLIDEVHILKDTRGATLEAVVSRMKTSGANVRFIALSATVPNSEDIAVWLGKDHTNDHIPAHRETFGEDFRPVKLQKHVYGFDGLSNEFAFEKVLDGKLPNLIQRHTQKKPIMVFCFTRKSCETTAVMLAEWWTRQRVVDRAWPAPTQKVNVDSKELRDLLGCGVAFHHAGLDLLDRHAVETAFLKGDVSVICCTSTLAVGVNLPCHLVVLKGTVCFQDRNLCEYSDLEVMQMLGRAGRPQFDDSAVAIIMTRSEKVDKYKKMISGQDILESTLHLNLIEHLNSEIGLGTVRDLYTAKKWLTGTFLSVRMRQNPDYYKLESVAPNRNSDERLEQVCERDIKLLQNNQLVEEKGGRLSSTEYGQAMSRYMVQFETMKLLLSLPYDAKTEQILQLLCQASEFKDLRMKPNERPSLREFNKSPFIKFPIKENISTTAHKISLMIQVQLGGVDMPTDKAFAVIRRQFGMEKNIIFERIQRLIRCIVDCKAFDCDAVSTRHALDLARSLSAEFWEKSNLQLRQIPQVGPATVRKLVTSNIKSVEELASQDTATIERIMGKNPPFGRKMLDTVAGFPRLTLASEIMGRPIIKTGQKPRVNVRVVLGFSNVKIPVWSGSRPSLTFIADTSDGKLVHFWRGSIAKLEKGFDLKLTVELSNPDDKIRCIIACDEIVGTLRSYGLDPGLPASAFPTLKLKQTTLQPRAMANKPHVDDADEFGTDDIGDDELLAAVEKAEASDNDSNGFADIGDFDDVPGGLKKVTIGTLESVQMENGKWTCSHQCRGDKLLKNGQQCKHKCCREGLDKRPRTQHARHKSSIGTGQLLPSESKIRNQGNMDKSETSKKDPKATGTNKGGNNKVGGVLKTKLKAAKHSDSNQQDIEIIDLAEELSPMPYSKLAPRQYRKLHNLHVSVQKNKLVPSVRLPKQKPQFSYASGNVPDLPFLRKPNPIDDDDIFGAGGSGEEDFPSPSALAAFLKGDGNDPFEMGNLSHEELLPASAELDNSLESLEAGMLDLEETVMRQPPTPRVNSSFVNGVFDFDAFDEKYGESNIFSSPLIRESRKRERPRSPALPETKKHRRIVKEVSETNPPTKPSDNEESSVTSEVPEVESRRIAKAQPAQQEVHQNKEQSTQQRSVPSWVGEFDAELIEGLMGIVDFVD